MAHHTSISLRTLGVMLLCTSVACGTDDGTGTDTSDDVTSDAEDTTTDAEPDVTDTSDVAPDVDIDTSDLVMCGEDPAVFPEFADDCTFASECAVAIHQVDCCGSMEAEGVRGDELEAFNAAESECRSEYPLCRCAALETVADDGRSSSDEAAFAVTCRDNTCFTFVPDSPIDCSGGGNNEFPTFDRTCTVDTECGWGLHLQDCCGTQVAMGMAASEVERFGWAERVCGSQSPDCDCPTAPTLTDDGQVVVDVDAVRSVCDAGVSGTTLAR